MEIILILNLYFIISLTLCDILKKKYFFKEYSILDIYLYLILYTVVLLTIFSAFDLINEFHSFLIILIIIFFSFNFKKLYNFNFVSFFKALFILNFFLILCIDKEFIWWDEFSSWGLRTKEILIHNSIFYDNVVTNLNKPSGSSLLHFIFLKYMGFNESVIIFSQFTITILMLNNILYDFKVKKYRLINIILFFLIIHFVSFIFNYGLFSIYTGVISSVLFLKIITILFIKNSENFKVKIFELFPIVFLIIFLKDFSLFYIIYIILILIVGFLNSGRKRFLNLINFVTFLVITFITLILQKYISIKLKTETNISNYSVHELFEIFLSMKINLEQLYSFNIFQGSIFRIPNQIIEKVFLKSEFFNEFGTNLIFWFMFFSILNIIIFLLNKDKFIKQIYVFISLFVISILHLLLILTSYHIFFGGPEATVKASFGRYMGLYFMPYTFFLIYYIFSTFDSLKLNLFLLVVYLNMAPAKSIEILIPSKLNSFNSNMKEIIHNKKNIKSLSKFVKKKYKSERAYILIDNDDGFILNMFKIYFYPYRVNNNCWSFKKNKEKTTFMFNCNYNNSFEIVEKLKKYKLIINYKKNKNYDDILTNNNFEKVENIYNAFIYKNKL